MVAFTSKTRAWQLDVQKVMSAALCAKGLNITKAWEAGGGWGVGEGAGMKKGMKDSRTLKPVKIQCLQFPDEQEPDL